MIRLILLIIATAATALFLYALAKGKDKQSLVEHLDESQYFLKDLYVVGFVLNDMKLFRLRGKIGLDLKKSNKLWWDNIYADYYTYLTWAQFLTLALLAIAMGFSFCAILGGEMALLMPFVVIMMIAVIWNVTMSKSKEAVEARRQACEMEFPNMVSKLSLMLTSGMVLREAWYLIAQDKEGPLYDMMKKSCDWMDNGESEISAIYKFGVLSDSQEIKKFTSALVQSSEKGNSELVGFLMSQVTELWAHKRQLALQQGELAAGKLIVPLGLMFGGIILIIVAAAMQSMSF